MTRRLRIAIVGYGIAGISAAIFLRRLGHEIVHFERSAATAPIGGGLLLNSAGLAILGWLGLRRAVMSCGAVVSRVRGETLSGRQVMDLRYEDHSSGNHGLGIQRAALGELLTRADQQAAALQTSTQISAVDAEQGYLFDRNQAHMGQFDLIVAADGANSSIRAGLHALVRHDRSYPCGALVCLLDDPNGIGGDCVFQSFTGTRHASIWPVGSRQPGAPRRINVSINMPLARSEELREIGAWKRTVASRCPRLAPLLEQTVAERDLLLFTYRDVALRRYYFGRVVLIGDAAHSMSPQLGQGASMALVDSWVLANALERNKDVDAALADFDRKRRAHMFTYQRVSRWLTPIFQSESRTLAALRDWAFYPLSQVPFVKGSMLRTLSGRQRGFFGTASSGCEDAGSSGH